MILIYGTLFYIIYYNIYNMNHTFIKYVLLKLSNRTCFLCRVIENIIIKEILLLAIVVRDHDSLRKVYLNLFKSLNYLITPISFGQNPLISFDYQSILLLLTPHEILILNYN